MQTLRKLFARGLRRGPAARLMLSDAYRRVFVEGGATHQDRELVLADLAAMTGFYQVSTPELETGALRFAEGKRYVFARIAHHLRMPSELRLKLESAAKMEQLTNTEEGEI